MKLLGLKKLLADLERVKKDYSKTEVEVIVGYSQTYAIYVHENLNASHKKGKQAKFLEAPARSMQGELGKTVASVFEKTKDFKKALLAAGYQLQRASQKLVPVDTGALKASAFTALKKDLDKKANAAFTRGFKKREKWSDDWHANE